MPRSMEKPQPCGTALVRLADITLDQRLKALDHLMRTGNVKCEEEAAVLLAIALEPGDHGGRVAA